MTRARLAPAATAAYADPDTPARASPKRPSAPNGAGFLYLSALASKARIAPKHKKPRTIVRGACDPDWIQTHDHLLRRQELYSAELPALMYCYLFNTSAF